MSFMYFLNSFETLLVREFSEPEDISIAERHERSETKVVRNLNLTWQLMKTSPGLGNFEKKL